MTHLSDFSFLQRANMFLYLFAFLLSHIWQQDRFAALSFSRVRNFELKSVVTILLLISIPFQLSYDMSSVKIKYSEGFMELPDGSIITKPRQFWDSADETLVLPTDYTLMLGFSFQTGTLFLLQSFWNYLAGSVARASFMGSLEFKLYIFWTACTIILFPVLQYIFRGSDLLTEVVPELAYGISLLIIAFIGVRSHFRFLSLIRATCELLNGKTITVKLTYFLEMNRFMTLFLFSDAFSLIILSGDALTPARYLNTNKFTADLLIANVNMCTIVIFFLIIMIVYPPANYGGIRSSMSASIPAFSNVPQRRVNPTHNASYNASGVNINMEEISSIQGDIPTPESRSRGHSIVFNPSNKLIREGGVDFQAVSAPHQHSPSPLGVVSYRSEYNDRSSTGLVNSENGDIDSSISSPS